PNEARHRRRARLTGEARFKRGKHRGGVAGTPIKEEQPPGRRGMGRIPVESSASLVFHGPLLGARGEGRAPCLRAALLMVSLAIAGPQPGRDVMSRSSFLLLRPAGRPRRPLAPPQAYPHPPVRRAAR